MTAILYIIIFWAIYFVGLIFAYLVSEKFVTKFGLFDFIPFNCRKCCTTWTLAAMYASWLFVDFNWVVLIAAIMITALTALSFRLTEIKKGNY